MSEITLTPARRWLGFAFLLLGGFLAPVDFFIVNTGLPSIRAGLNATPAEVELVISGYAGAYAVFLITGGRLGDLYGRRRSFLCSMAAFIATSVLCGVAPSAVLLVFARMAEGLSAAVLAPQVLGSLRALFPRQRELGRAMSFYGMMMGLAAATGQLAGGLLIAASPFGLDWRAIFLVNVPVGSAALLGAWFLVPETSAMDRPRLDLIGAGLISIALICVVLPLSVGRQNGWPAWTWIMLLAAPMILGAFLVYEDRLASRGGMPLLSPGLLGIASFRRGSIVATLFFFTAPFYLLFALDRQDGVGLNALQTGLAILPYGVGLFLGPLASTPLVDRFHQRLLPFGLVVEVAGYAATAAVIAAGKGGPLLVGTVFIGGFGQGIAMPRLFNAAMQDVPPAQGGVAAGVVNSMLQVGAAVSVAAVGTLFFAALDGGAGPAAYGRAFGIAMIAVVIALSGAAILSFPARRPGLSGTVRAT